VPDPTITDPDNYSVVFENDRVRVLEYRDEPGAQTRPHEHPDSVMVTLPGSIAASSPPTAGTAT
jgi:beta-alanine degradation protein BauB